MTLAVAGTVTTVSACGGTQDDDVADVAKVFASALETGDGPLACSVLAHSTRSELEQSSGDPCERAILDETTRVVGSPIDVDAYGTMARARYEQDTLFLTRFESGWLVMAAACTPAPSVDGYDCKVKGS